MTILKTDWQSTEPVYYHERSGKISRYINDVIDFRNLEFHPEGLNNYLDYGFSVFYQTPVKHVKFLPPSSSIENDEQGNFNITIHPEPVEKYYGHVADEHDVIEQFVESVRSWEKSFEGPIFLPLSGGFDSRFLAWAIKDKKRIQAFTYGQTRNQENSFEVIHAKTVCRKLGIQWENVLLENFHQYFDAWDQDIGPSVHAHGMYHYEFYNKVIERISGSGIALLSGIHGDAWAGGVAKKNILIPEQMKFSGGLNADSRFSLLKSDHSLRDAYWENNRTRLNDYFWQVIHKINTRAILIAYLVQVPIIFGFKPWSPFFDIDLSLNMFSIPRERLNNRQWQREIFQKAGIYVESQNLGQRGRHGHNYIACMKKPLKPLNKKLLSELISPAYIDWVNRHSDPSRFLKKTWHRISETPVIGGVLHRTKLSDPWWRAYYAYLTLKPIENLIIKRNTA